MQEQRFPKGLSAGCDNNAVRMRSVSPALRQAWGKGQGGRLQVTSRNGLLAALACIALIVPQCSGQTSITGLVNGGLNGNVNTPGVTTGMLLFPYERHALANHLHLMYSDEAQRKNILKLHSRH